MLHLIFRYGTRHRGIVAEYLVDRQVKWVITLSAPSEGDRSSALRFERFEVEQTRRIQPPPIALSSEKLARDIGRRCIRPSLTNGV
jgi:hypothetical protein